jgi:hypothetical protein
MKRGYNWGLAGETPALPSHQRYGAVSGQPASATTDNRLPGVGQPQETEHGDRHDLAENGETVEQKCHDSANDGRFDQINQTHTTYGQFNWPQAPLRSAHPEQPSGIAALTHIEFTPFWRSASTGSFIGDFLAGFTDIPLRK